MHVQTPLMNFHLKILMSLMTVSFTVRYRTHIVVTPGMNHPTLIHPPPQNTENKTPQYYEEQHAVGGERKHTHVNCPPCNPCSHLSPSKLHSCYVNLSPVTQSVPVLDIVVLCTVITRTVCVQRGATSGRQVLPCAWLKERPHPSSSVL